MSNKNDFDSFSLDELKKMKKVVDSFDDVDSLKNSLSCFIDEMEKKKSNINERFDLALMVRLQIVDPFQLKVLKNNMIHNIQELIDCDLDSLVGITPSMKKEFDWIRKIYDLRGMVEDIPKQKKIGEK